MKRLLMTLAALVALAACSDTVHGVEYAEPAVAQFRDMMKAGQFEQIYDSAAPEFRNAISRTDGVALFSAIDRKLGKLDHADKISWNVNTRNMTTLVVLAYRSKYHDGEATETFTIKVDDGKGAIIGYNIDSLAMLIK